MVSQSPNERRADRSITARVFYFIIGAFAGAYLVLNYYPATSPSPVIFVGAVIGAGLLGLLTRRLVFELFRI